MPTTVAAATTTTTTTNAGVSDPGAAPTTTGSAGLFFTLNPDLEGLSSVDMVAGAASGGNGGASSSGGAAAAKAADGSSNGSTSVGGDSETAAAATVVVPAAVAANGESKEDGGEQQQQYQLEYCWRVWEQIENDAQQKNYTDNMMPIKKFSTVQEFWQLWSLLPQPSQLMSDKRMVLESAGTGTTTAAATAGGGSSSNGGEEDSGPSAGGGGSMQFVDAIMIFRDGIRPMWEDPLNQNGGHFEIRYQHTREPTEQARVDEHWNSIVLGVIGGTLEPANMVTGVRMVDKLFQGRVGFIRIEVWFTDIGAPELRNVLKQNIDDIMTTKIDGTKEQANRVHITLKLHNKSR